MPNRPKLLLVEDDAAAALHRTRTLPAAGFAVTEVRTAADATTAFAKTKFRIVLCDIRLPDGNGYELCRTLHRQAPDIPVVLISAAYGDDAARTTATYAGAVEFLAEPVPPATLVEKIRHHIGESDATTAR